MPAFDAGIATKLAVDENSGGGNQGGFGTENDGNTVTLTLATGTTYTVEAAFASGNFTVSIAPQ